MADEPTKTEEKTADNKAEEKPKESKTIHVKVHAPYKVYFDGEAVSVSAVNDTGPFDVLLGHHNFMTLLNQCDIVIRTDRDEETVPISKGIMHVKANAVIIFLDV